MLEKQRAGMVDAMAEVTLHEVKEIPTRTYEMHDPAAALKKSVTRLNTQSWILPLHEPKIKKSINACVLPT